MYKAGGQAALSKSIVCVLEISNEKIRQETPSFICCLAREDNTVQVFFGKLKITTKCLCTVPNPC